MTPSSLYVLVAALSTFWAPCAGLEKDSCVSRWRYLVTVVVTVVVMALTVWRYVGPGTVVFLVWSAVAVVTSLFSGVTS